MTFTGAHDRWFPFVLYRKKATPRAIERFSSRVRFYAMTQRDAAPPGSAGSPHAIPEDALVALSVMQHAGENTMKDVAAGLGRDIDAAWRARLMTDYEAALRYRAAFRRMSEGVSM